MEIKKKIKNGANIFSVAHVLLKVVLQIILLGSSSIKKFHFEVKFCFLFQVRWRNLKE